jgi:hypothetical protein
MTTWNTLVDYVQSNYKIADQSADRIKMVFDVGDMRSQVVFLWRATLQDGKEEWVQIESPFGRLDDVDLKTVVREVGEMVCGGLAVVGDLLTLRHSFPIMNMDINEFERPLHLVTTSADRLERKFSGGDTF